jgi:hypothetical protein
MAHRETSLHRNPFFVLGVTTRDNKSKIIQIAEDKALEIDHEICQKVRSDLTTPRTRLVHEMSWLPGLSPRKSMQLLEMVSLNPMSIREETGLPILAHANLMSAAFELIDSDESSESIAEFIQEMAFLVDELSPYDVLRDINEERVISSFPEVKAIELIDSELSEIKRNYRNVIKDALNKLSPTKLVETMTFTVDSVTTGGEDHAPELIDELVDSYALETQEFLTKEAENINKIIERIRNSASNNAGNVDELIEKLVGVSRNWDKVAQPIQLSAKARGISHELSRELAFLIRDLAIHLYNNHDLLKQAQRITNLLMELFAELPEIIERVEQDANALEDIENRKSQAEDELSQWENEITYKAEIGLIFKDVLSISPNGVCWKDKCYALDKITRVRWGAISQSVNGIPTGTNYTIGFGDDRSEAVATFQGHKKIYSAFVDKLWRAVCIRLLDETVRKLKDGHEIRIGEGVLRDSGVTLIKHKVFGANEAIEFLWSQTQILSNNGSFYISGKDHKKTYAELSYISTPNAHIIEQIIRIAFKKPGMRKLSDILL